MKKTASKRINDNYVPDMDYIRRKYKKQLQVYDDIRDAVEELRSLLA